jgi:hypothetical protein
LRSSTPASPRACPTGRSVAQFAGIGAPLIFSLGNLTYLGGFWAIGLSYLVDASGNATLGLQLAAGVLLLPAWVLRFGRSPSTRGADANQAWSQA